MTDALMARAVREELAAIARKHVKLWHIPLIACAAAISYFGLTSGSPWWWIPVFQTATERLEISWEEMTALWRLPSFWLFLSSSGRQDSGPIELAFARSGCRLQVPAAGKP